VACARGHYHAAKQLHDSGHKLKIPSETLAVAKDQLDQAKLEWGALRPLEICLQSLAAHAASLQGSAKAHAGELKFLREQRVAIIEQMAAIEARWANTRANLAQAHRNLVAQEALWPPLPPARLSPRRRRRPPPGTRSPLRLPQRSSGRWTSLAMAGSTVPSCAPCWTRYHHHRLGCGRRRCAQPRAVPPRGRVG